jgi:hypothetical protein
MAFTDVGGTPVELSAEAWEDIMRSGQQGSVFPQALAEMFTEAKLDVTISIDSVPKDTVFSGAASEEKLLVTTITPVKRQQTMLDKPGYIAYTNLSDLWELRLAGRRGFHAVDTAREFVRLYRLYYRIN